MTLTEFILARVAEWEAEREHHYDPARVLAQCAAYRSIVTMWNAEAYTNDEGDILGGQGPETHHEALCHLATIWADHPDYDPDWAV